MLATVLPVLHHPLVHAAFTGAVGAATIDYRAFLTWKSAADAAKYDWGVAAWRWLQGAITGLVAGAAGGGLIGLLG